MKQMSKEEVLNEAENRGFNYEAHHHDCAQSTLLALMDVFELKADDAFKAATGFAGGVGRIGHLCGTFSGAIMAFSLLYGRDIKDMLHPEEAHRLKVLEEAEIKIQDMVLKLRKKYEENYGAIECRGIQKKVYGRWFDLTNPEDFAEMKKMGAYEDKAPSVVGRGSRWAAELIYDELKKDGRI